MDRFIAESNIARFEAMLRKESDPDERQMLEALLREERAKLAIAEVKPSEEPRRAVPPTRAVPPA
ncbi:MAG TPA: hypothetical protein VGC09_20110 [Rhodopila sp.]